MIQNGKGMANEVKSPRTQEGAGTQNNVEGLALSSGATQLRRKERRERGRERGRKERKNGP